MARRIRFPLWPPGTVLATGVIVITGVAGTAWAQVPSRASVKATTVEAVLAYPMFFHTQAVRLRGEVRMRDGVTLLVEDAQEVLLFERGGPASPRDRAQVTGTFVDVGRLEPGDPRLRGVDGGALAQARLGKPWPGIGELLVLLADEIGDAPGFTAPSVRALALEPGKFEDQVVTVIGRFRGRNLFGDQPTAPGRSRWDFVLASGDAAVWVTGMRPRGDGFDLSIESRTDADRWLEVKGTVRAARGVVFVEATQVRLGKAPGENAPSEPVARVATPLPPPEVVFSMPTEGESDVTPATAVRIQFSRDLDTGSLKGRIRAAYLASQAEERGEAQAPRVDFTYAYNEGTRVLEIRFRQPLERFRTLQVDLLEGILGTDGVPMRPWMLRFSLGG
jgi:hypothetical protein